MTTTTYRFQVIKYPIKRSGKCPGCGKRVSRSRTFEATVNPFNKNSDGSIRTPSEIRALLRSDAERWVPDFTHEACES